MINPVTPYDEKKDNLAHWGQGLANKEYACCIWSQGNCTDKTLNAVAHQALKSGKLSPETPILTKADFSYWTIKEEAAFKQSTISYRLYQLVKSNEVFSQIITEKLFSLGTLVNPPLELLSSTIPHIPYPHLNKGEDVIRFFRDTIQRTAPCLTDVRSVE